MTKIEYGKKYGDDDMYITYQKTGHGQKCIKITGVWYEDGEKDDTKDFFINSENILAENEKCIIISSCPFPTIAEELYYEYIDAGIGGAVSQKESMKKDKKLALNLLTK